MKIISNIKIRFLLALLMLIPSFMVLGQAGQDTFADNFNGGANYANSTGSQAWATDWIESGDDGTAGGGNIFVSGFNDLEFGDIDAASITRALDLSAYAEVELSLFYVFVSSDGEDEEIDVQLWNDTTSSWETVLTTGGGFGTLTHTLTADQISANSQIRFISSGGDTNWDPSDVIAIDNVLFTASQYPINTPLVLFEKFSGYYDYTATGGVYRTSETNQCTINTPPPVQLTGTIPATATIEQAYLFWAHSGLTPDTQVTFEGQTINAQITNQGYLNFNGDNNFYGMIGDVTSLIQGITNINTNNFDFSGLTIDNTNTNNNFCSNNTVLGGWSLMIFYTDPSLPAARINLYNGFAGQRSTTSNFSLDSFFAINPTGAKTTLLSWEGDIGLANSESLTLTAQPSGTVTTLSGDRGNTGTNPFNSSRYNEITGEDVATFGLDLDTYDLSNGEIAAGDTEITTNVGVGLDFVIMNAVVLKVPSNLIVGTVYEDVNYPGGTGRNVTASSGIPVANARVELYDGSDNFVESTTTDASGEYVFGGMVNGTYKVRVVNNTVTSSRGGGSACATCFPVQTFRRNYTASTLSDVTNEVGGANPSGEDPGAVTTVGASLPAGSQTVSTVTITDEGAVDLDFGFNFNTIVNTNQNGQGSLEQFIVNSNNLDETGLDIAVHPNDGSLDPAAGEDTSIFMIPASSLTGTLPNQYFDIAITGGNTLSPITSDNTFIDGRTQTAFTTDTNTGTVGSGGTTVGTSANVLPNYNLPEIQVHQDDGNVFIVQANNIVIRNISVYSDALAGISIQSGSATITENLIGVDATGTAVSGQNILDGVIITGGTATVEANYISANERTGVRISGGTSTILQDNHITDNGVSSGGSANCDGNIRITGGSGIQIRRNLVQNAASVGIDSETGSDGVIISENTIVNNGISTNTCQDIGIRVRGSNFQILNNIINNNIQDGIVIEENASSGNLISQNSIYANGQLGIDLSFDNGGDGVNLNDNGDSDVGPNAYVNFPIFESASISGNQLKIVGWARPGAILELFLSDIGTGSATVGDNQITGPLGAVTQDYGEGETYLTTVIEGSVDDNDSTTNSLYNDVDNNTDTTNRFSFTITLGTAIPVGSIITATATDPITNATSEFGGAYTIGAATVITNRRITYRAKQN